MNLLIGNEKATLIIYVFITEHLSPSFYVQMPMITCMWWVVQRWRSRVQKKHLKCFIKVG